MAQRAGSFLDAESFLDDAPPKATSAEQFLDAGAFLDEKPVDPAKPKRGFLGTLGQSALSGLETTEDAAAALASTTGAIEPKTAAEIIARRDLVADDFEQPESISRFQQLLDGGQYWDAAKIFLGSPIEITGNVVAQSLGTSAVPIITGAGGALAGSVAGPAGTVVGGAAGLGTGSALVEAGATILDTIAKSGVNMRDPGAIATALQDPALMEQAKESAVKRGVAIGAFDAATAGMAGRFVAGARTLAGRIGRGSAEVGIQAAGGAGGEAAAQLLDEGRISSPSAIVFETIGEAGAGVPEIVAGARLRRQDPAAVTQTPAQDAAVPPVLPDLPGVGTVVGIKQPDGAPERGVIEAIQDGFVFWRDETGARRADAADEFARDITTAPPPRDPVQGDATTVGEPDLPPAPPGEAYDLEAAIEPDPAPSRPPPPPSPQQKMALPQTEAIDRKLRAARVYRENAEAARQIGSKSPDEIALMERQAETLETEATELQRAIAATSRQPSHAGMALAEDARQRQRIGELGSALQSEPGSVDPAFFRAGERPPERVGPLGLERGSTPGQTQFTAEELQLAAAARVRPTAPAEGLPLEPGGVGSSPNFTDEEMRRAAEVRERQRLGELGTADVEAGGQIDPAFFQGRPREGAAAAVANPPSLPLVPGADAATAPGPTRGRKGKAAKRSRRKPVSLLEFLSATGLKDSRGDLMSMGFGQWHKQKGGRRRLVRDDGISLDEARMRAHEAGYIGRPGQDIQGAEGSDINDLLEAMDREFRGRPVYTLDESTDVEQAEKRAREEGRFASLSPEDQQAEIVRTQLVALGEQTPVVATLEDLQAQLDERLAMMGVENYDEALSLMDEIDRAIGPDAAAVAAERTFDGDFDLARLEVPAATRDPAPERDAAGEQQPEAEPGGPRQGEESGGDTAEAQPADGGTGAAELATEQTDQGTQTVIPGAERSAQQAQDARDAKGGLQSGKPQKSADEGLFAPPDRQLKLTAGIDPSDIGPAIVAAVNAIGDGIRNLRGDKASLSETAKAAQKVAAAPAGAPGSLRRLSAWGRYWSMASALAARDSRSARYFNSILGRDRLKETLEREAAPLLAPYTDLTNEQKERVNRVLEHDRITGTERRNTGRRVVLRVGDDLQSRKLQLSKPGDLIALSPEETRALFAVRSLMDRRLMQLGEGWAREQGYEGEFTREAIGQAIASASDVGKRRAAERAKQYLDMLEEQRRRGYVPLGRHGQWYVKVMPRQTGEGGKPSLEDGWYEFVEADKPLDWLFSEREAAKLPASVTEARTRLEKKFPPDRYSYEIGQVTPKAIDMLDIGTVEKLVNSLTEKDMAAGAKLYDELLTKLYEERMAGFRKTSRNIPGYSTDFERSIADYVRQTSSVVANAVYGKQMEDAFDATQEHADPRIRDYWKAHREHVESTRDDFARLRQFGFFQFLWGSPASALVNLSQTPLVTANQIASWAGPRGMGHAYKAMMEVMTAIRPTATGFALNWERLGRTPAERKLIAEMRADGTMDPAISLDLQGGDIVRKPSMRPLARRMRKVYDIGASMYNVAEQANRAAAALAYYRAAQIPEARAKAAKVYGQDAMWREMVGRNATPEAIARFGVDETQFIGGKLNRAPLMRGPGALVMQFQTYPANYLRLIYKNFTRQGIEGKAAGTLMIMMLVAASGLMGLPFADDLLAVGEAAYKFATGQDPLLERKFRQAMIDAGMSAEGTEAIMRGPSRAAGIDLSRRLGMGDIAPNVDWIDAFGPFAAATLGRGMETYQRWASGQTAGAVASASQAVIGKGGSDLVRGLAQLPSEGYATRAGNVKVKPGDVTAGEMAARSIGFQPTRFARRSEHDIQEERVARANQVAQSRLLTNLARLSVDEQGADSTARAALQKRREAVIAKAVRDGLKVPDASTIKQRVQQLMAPDEARIKRAPKAQRSQMLNSPFPKE
jgi:hypothetical protein